MRSTANDLNATDLSSSNAMSQCLTTEVRASRTASVFFFDVIVK